MFSREADKWSPIYIQMKALVFFPLKNVISFLNLANFFINYVKEPPCTQSTPSSCRCSQWELINTTSWRNKYKYECLVGYNIQKYSREADKFISKWKPLFSTLRILYHFWIWPIPSYIKEPPCTLRTHSVGTNQHYTLWRNKNKYKCLVGYNFRCFQGRPTNLYPNESLCSPLEECYIIFEFGQFLHKLC